MPIYDYRCTKCETVYDVFHKGKEIQEDIVCPSCGSTEHKKLMSVPSVQIHESSGSCSSAPSCESGGCCGGACGLN
ncbi:MAG TPA: zinc ribbon domain-containing protein [Bacteroidota bacterium]|nr:zinc ribbon domain-containing protein [Bacteroidota bacterium]